MFNAVVSAGMSHDLKRSMRSALTAGRYCTQREVKL